MLGPGLYGLECICSIEDDPFCWDLLCSVIPGARRHFLYKVAKRQCSNLYIRPIYVNTNVFIFICCIQFLYIMMINSYFPLTYSKIEFVPECVPRLSPPLFMFANF